MSRLSLTDDAVVPILLFIVLGAFAWMTPAQNDTWWHLRSGREIWDTGSFLLTERFSHTAFGTESANHWWLTQLAFYGLFVTGGPMLLTVFAGACAFTAVLGSWRFMHGSWEVRLGLLLFLLLATAPEWAVRPQVVSLALLVVTASVVIKERIGWLPLVCVIWANAHALVVFGVVMGGAAALEALVWSRARLRRDVAIAACCAAAPLVSPLGWHYWPQVLRTVSLSRALQLQEYRTPADAGAVLFWIAAAALVTLAFVRRDTLAQWRRGDRVLLIAAGLLAIAAASAARNIAFFAVIAAPVLSWLLTASDIPERSVRRPAGVVGHVLIATAMLVAAVAVATRWRDGGASLGWQPLSAKVIDAVRGCPDPIFNQFEDGGPLMWALPTRRVFVDSRIEAYPLDLLRRSREADLRGNYVDLFREYGIRCAVVATDSTLGERLARDPSMSALRSDARRTVFVRSAGR